MKHPLIQWCNSRCNDVLELVQTTRHFRLLSDAAEVGGAGSASLDALVKEIHQKYTVAMADFFSRVSNVLSIDGSQGFEDAFFNFRSIVKVWWVFPVSKMDFLLSFLIFCVRRKFQVKPKYYDVMILLIAVYEFQCFYGFSNT